jgi:hypothetical protein
VILLVAFAAVAAGLVLGVHANKHSMADVVRNCPSDNIGLKLLNPITGRVTILCEYEPDQFGRLVIDSDGKSEVTAYADSHNPINNLLRKCVPTLYRGGYNHVQYIRPDLLPKVIEILAALR